MAEVSARPAVLGQGLDAAVEGHEHGVARAAVVRVERWECGAILGLAAAGSAWDHLGDVEVYSAANSWMAENRWSGANFSHYVNPTLDGLIDQLYTTVGNEQAQVIKQMADILAEDVPILPLYFKMSFVAVRQGVRAMTDDYPATVDSGAAARHAYLWERD